MFRLRLYCAYGFYNKTLISTISIIIMSALVYRKKTNKYARPFSNTVQDRDFFIST